MEVIILALMQSHSAVKWKSNGNIVYEPDT